MLKKILCVAILGFNITFYSIVCEKYTPENMPNIFSKHDALQQHTCDVFFKQCLEWYDFEINKLYKHLEGTKPIHTHRGPVGWCMSDTEAALATLMAFNYHLSRLKQYKGMCNGVNTLIDKINTKKAEVKSLITSEELQRLKEHKEAFANLKDIIEAYEKGNA